MRLDVIPPQFVDFAWRDGASCLAEACATVEEITGDQLKMLLARGERTLLSMKDGDEKTVGWATFRVDQLPNVRVLHLCDLVAHGAGFENFLGELRKVAYSLGCSRIRCSCLPAQARLFISKCGFMPVYETLEVEV